MTPSPDDALEELARLLREDGAVLASYVGAPRGEPLLGRLVARGSRASAAPGEYALVVEAVREGYLLHYGVPRVVSSPDVDLALLAGDYLYARGLDRLAQLEDADAVAELAELISACASLHADARADDAETLWIASVVAIATGPDQGHRARVRALRSGVSGVAPAMLAWSRERASSAGAIDALEHAVEAIDFARLRG